MKGDLRLVGLDVSASSEDVIIAICSYGNCVKGDIKVRDICTLNNGLCTSWVQCPLGATVKIANLGKIGIDWTFARVDLLATRPTQCFKCWRFGHLRNACKSGDDFSGLCFECNDSGHAARQCLAPPACKICLIDGKALNHRQVSGMRSAVQSLSKGATASISAQAGASGSTRRVENMEICKYGS